MKKLYVGQYSHTLTDLEINEEDLVFEGQAEPTSRLLEGSSDSWAAEEWVQFGTLKGQDCKIYYLFGENDIVNEDGEPLEPEDYPWDGNHISWVEVEDIDKVI